MILSMAIKKSSEDHSKLGRSNGRYIRTEKLLIWTKDASDLPAARSTSDQSHHYTLNEEFLGRDQIRIIGVLRFQIRLPSA